MIAQWAEQPPRKRQVAGSIPARGFESWHGCMAREQIRVRSSKAERGPHKPQVAGSNPAVHPVPAAGIVPAGQKMIQG